VELPDFVLSAKYILNDLDKDDEIGGEKRVYTLFVGKPEGNRPKMDLGEIGWGGVDWIGLAQDRDKGRAFVNMVMNLQVPHIVGKLLSCCTTDGLLSSTCVVD
jgi:hypothetical protein